MSVSVYSTAVSVYLAGVSLRNNVSMSQPYETLYNVAYNPTNITLTLLNSSNTLFVYIRIYVVVVDYSHPVSASVLAFYYTGYSNTD